MWDPDIPFECICPKCGHEEDCDEFGFIYCEKCKYCIHPSAQGTDAGNWKCDVCGKILDAKGYEVIDAN